MTLESVFAKYRSRIMRWLPLVTLLFALPLAGCHNDEGRIPADTFEAILYDVMRTNGAMGVMDSLAAQVHEGRLDPYAGILQRHGVTRAQFDSTLHYYCEQPDAFEPIIERLVGRLQELESEMHGESEAPDSMGMLQAVDPMGLDEMMDSIE